jgi:hypothetical protein
MQTWVQSCPPHLAPPSSPSPSSLSQSSSSLVPVSIELALVQLLPRPHLHRAHRSSSSPPVPIELAVSPASHLTAGPAPPRRRSPSSSSRSSSSRHRRSSSSPHCWSISSPSLVLLPRHTVQGKPPSMRWQEERVERIQDGERIHEFSCCRRPSRPMRVCTRLLLELIQSAHIMQKPHARRPAGGAGDGQS